MIITHKLHEVMEVSDRVAVLRKGHDIGCVKTSETIAAGSLSDMMVGHAHHARTSPARRPRTRSRGITVRDLTCVDNADGVKRLDKVSFVANSGEILGIAGIAGCGPARAAGVHCRACVAVAVGLHCLHRRRRRGEQNLLGMDPLAIK